MADQVFAASSGFYNSVSNDREYYAEDMNKPYQRLVSEGIYATPQGTPSTDLYVQSNSGMGIVVKKGQGLFAGKWFSLDADQAITVPNNTSTVARIDSVLVQVDTRSSWRVANIVYREGTPSANPVAPSINETTDVFEYRIANIRVTNGASAISQSNITDLRGTETPWITSLINQVDTSALFSQWQNAFERYYASATSDYDEYTEEQRDAWEQFVSTLTSELTATMNLVRLWGTEMTREGVNSYYIDITEYNPSTDILFVFINGLMANDDMYTITESSGEYYISFTNPLTGGQKLDFYGFHAVIGGDLQTTETLIQSLDARLSAELADSDWNNLVLENGEAFDLASTPQYRKIGKVVYLRGAVKGISALNTVIGTLPTGYRPSSKFYYPSVVFSGTTIPATAYIQIKTDGLVVLRGASQTLSGSLPVTLTVSFPV